MRPPLPDEAGHLLRLARHHGRIARRRERVADEAQRLRVVVHHEDGHRPVPAPRPAGRAWCGVGPAAELLREREGEGEACALARAAALRPDAPPMRLDQPLADGEPQAAGGCAVPGVAARQGDVLAEQVRETLRRNALALVAHRDRNVHAVA